MARLVTEGFELGDLLPLSGYSSASITGSARTGSYCVALTAGGSWWISFPSRSEVYAFVCYKNQFDYFGDILALYSSGVMIANIRNETTPISPRLYLEGTLIGESLVMLPTVTWGMFELHLRIDDAPNGIVEAKFNGINFASFTGDTRISATTVDVILGSRWTGGNHYWDDIAVNDVNGGVDDTWVGDCHVEYHPANGNGDVNDWTGSDGDKVNNYALVSDIPQNGDTNYVQSSTPTEQDLYAVTDFTDTGKTIRRIWAECRAKDARNTSGNIKLGFKTGGTTYLSGNKTLPGVYSAIRGDDAVVNPADSGIWEKADIDAIQYAQECE